MCGIAGILAPGHQDRIGPMTKVMAHRGPDDEGFYHGQGISLGQRRLSIIDLSGGHQPIANETGKLQLVCNGEIYNSPELRRELEGRGHTFRTHTDVEVILHLYEDYGRDCVKYLRGMFAFALWDEAERELFLGRDHLGQKPVFWVERDGVFAFGSEVKSLLASGLVDPEPNLDGIWHYMSLRTMPDRHTFFQGIHKLPAASTLFYSKGRSEVRRYWDLSFEPKRKGSEADLLDELDHLLRETVELHLLSDVPVGTFLSGGIDSSLMTAMMAKARGGASFPTFSIGVKEQAFNELPFARMVSDQYGLEAHETVVEADMIHMIPSMIHHMDEPSDPFGVGVYLVSREAAKEVKVVLSGDGGDENFAGYDRFAGQRLADYYSVMPHWFRNQIMARLLKLVPESYAYKSLAQKFAWLNDMANFNRGERYARSTSFLRFTSDHKQELFTEATRSRLQEPDSTQKILEHFNAENADELVDRMLYTDLMTRMPDHLLAIADRMSMAHSLESRPPLMDYKLVEFAARLPGKMKLRGRSLKHCLRQVSSRYLPRELIYREKQGFGFPIGIWLRTELKDLLNNLFAQSRFVEMGWFNPDAIRTLLDEHIDGTADHNFRIWILLNLEIWYRLYFENETVDSMQAFVDQIK